ncbi:hypothetical protein Tco_1278145 [Tanacetum coccineum]
MEKFETPPDSPPVIIIDPDDQPMWSSTRTVAPTLSYAIVQLPISKKIHNKGTHMQMIRDNQFDGRIWSDPHRYIADFLKISNLFQYGENQEEAFRRLLNDIHNFHQLDNKTLVAAWLHLKEMLLTCYGYGLSKGTIIQLFYHGLDDPTQGIIDAGGIFLYKTPNEALKILEDKVLLKLNFSNDSQNNPKPKTDVSSSGSNIIPDHELLTNKFKALATKIDYEFQTIRKELKKMRDGHRDNHASQIYMKNDTQMCDLMEANYVQGYHGGYHDQKPINLYPTKIVTFLNPDHQIGCHIHKNISNYPKPHLR